MNLLHSNTTWFLGDAANCTLLDLHRSAWRRWPDTRDGDGEMMTWWALWAAPMTRQREEELEWVRRLLVALLSQSHPEGNNFESFLACQSTGKDF